MIDFAFLSLNLASYRIGFWPSERLVSKSVFDISYVQRQDHHLLHGAVPDFTVQYKYVIFLRRPIE